ncbi:MAG: prenyltransferase [Roseiflexaceae bacterium]|jgi:1,4-dihydroxy-2-naphthoate octaprenyltransferase|nr:prenyltransferase [Chloroflexaceae bacterium]
MLAMWGKALRTIPRLSGAEWNALDIVSRWLVATRAAVLVMTGTSATIAGVWAWHDGQFNWVLWGCLFVGLTMAHATNNLLNDLIDYRAGVDHNNYFRAQYGPQPLVHGLLDQRGLLLYVAVTGLIALIPGAYLVWLRGELALYLLLTGAVFVVFYTWPLKYIGMGEIAVLAVWGPLMVGGGYFVITGQWSWAAVLISLPQTLAATTVLFGKHIDKMPSDRASKIYTLPVVLGDPLARYVAVALFVAEYAIVAWLIITGVVSPFMAIVLLALPHAWAAIKVFVAPRPDAPPANYPPDVWPLWYAPYAFVHTRNFGLLFLVGLIIDAIVRQLWP